MSDIYPSVNGYKNYTLFLALIKIFVIDILWSQCPQLDNDFLSTV